MVIGVTGTNGSGKGTVVDYLKSKGFIHYSAREFIYEEIDRRGLPRNRDTTNLVANDMRKTFGPAHIIQSLYERALEARKDAVVESVRTLGEAERLKKDGMVIFAVDADKKVRYERSVARGTELDKISFEKFCEQEDREMAQTQAWDMNVFGVMKMADAIFTNNGTLPELHAQIDEALLKAGAKNDGK